MKRKLTDSYIKKTTAKPDGKPCNYTDGGGMYLHVKPTGRFWRYNYRIDGKMKTLSIGNYSEIGLQVARQRHQEARDLLARGVDPSTYKQTKRLDRVEAATNSFEAVAREWCVKHLADLSESHRTRTTRYLEKDVLPFIGARPIAELRPREIIPVIERIQKRTVEAHLKVLEFIGQICRYAVASDRAESDPTASLRGYFKRGREEEHLPAITDPVEMGRLLRAIDNYHGNFLTLCALKLSALMMLRPGELITAEWSEIDLESATWSVEIRHMKAKTSVKKANKYHHIVPLPEQAIAIFRELHPFSGHCVHVFTGVHNRKSHMCKETVLKALHRMGFKGQMCAHGFRGMASTRLNEMRDPEGRRVWDSDTIERQLAHKEKDVVKGAYDRSQHLDERRRMMQAWADYLDGLKATTGQVIPFKAKAG